MPPVSAVKGRYGTFTPTILFTSPAQYGICLVSFVCPVLLPFLTIYSAAPAHLNLTCTPVAPTPSEHAIFEGWLSDNYLGAMEPQQQVSKSLGVCFVATGTFDFRVEAVQVGEDGRVRPGVERSAGVGFVSVVVG